MNIKESFISVFVNWKNFSGRACRSEFWYFCLSAFLIAFLLALVEVVLGIFNEEIGYGPLSLLFQIIVIIPSISVTSRRLQDRGCLLYTSPSPRDATLSRMPSSA